jgi:hypothetical protein
MVETERFNMCDVLDKDYTSLVNISRMLSENRVDNENFLSVLIRTLKISNNILTDNRYNKSIYVTHLSVINCILFNIYTLIYECSCIEELNKSFSVFDRMKNTDDKSLEGVNINYDSLESFCTHNMIDKGQVVKLSINRRESQISMSIC